jgi:hypothetical protein
MSGRKSTSWQWEQRSYQAALAQERRRLAEAAKKDAEARRALEVSTQRLVKAEVTRYCPEIHRLIESLRRVEAQADHPVRRAYAQEFSSAIELATSALRAAENAEMLVRYDGATLVNRGLSTSSPELAELGSITDELKAHLSQLHQITNAQAPQRQQDIARSTIEIESSLANANGVLGQTDDVVRWETELVLLRDSLSEGRFDEAEATASRLKSEVDTAIGQAEVRNNAYEERLSVLMALREATHHLGYKELNPKALEQAIAEGEAIWELRVDTRGKGAMTFFVSDDQIRAESRLGVRSTDTDTDRCFGEFARIEERLANEHHLVTEFTSSEEPPLPRPSAAGSSRSLPKSSSTVRKASK